MLRTLVLTLALLVGCGAGEATQLTTDLGAVEVVAPVPKPNPFTTSCLRVANAITLPDAKATCSRSSLEVDVTNTCAFSVRVSSERSGPFGVSRPIELAPNTTGAMTFVFLPTTSGPHTASLQLIANADGFTQRTAIAVDATASAPRTASVETTVPPYTPNELLIIIDDDGLPDVDREISNMALSLASTFTRIVVSDLSGTVQRPDDLAVLASESPTFVDRFTRAMHPPRAVGKRSCHETALRLMKQRQPAGFWSSTAPRRGIACIMNEADQSDLPASSMLAAWSVRSEDSPTPFLVVTPIGQLDTCGFADARLEQLALSTGGARETLCQPDWSRLIETFQRSDGWSSFMLRLPATPSVRSVERLVVTVDGGRLAPSSWRFDTVRNAVVLPPLVFPEPGQTVRATWETCDD